jgi:hypothetical protein
LSFKSIHLGNKNIICFRVKIQCIKVKVHYDNPFFTLFNPIYWTRYNWLFPKCDVFNFEVTIWSLCLIVLTFTKFMLFNKISKKYYNVNKEPWVYLCCTQLSWVPFSFQTILLFGFINHPNKHLKWILCIYSFQNIYYLSFENDFFSIFQFFTYLWSTPWIF